MKLNVEIFRLDDPDKDPEKVGDIWTDGKSIFIDPSNNRMMKNIKDDMIEGGGEVIYPSKNPIKFIRFLHGTYRERIIASEAVMTDE